MKFSLLIHLLTGWILSMCGCFKKGPQYCAFNSSHLWLPLALPALTLYSLNHAIGSSRYFLSALLLPPGILCFPSGLFFQKPISQLLTCEFTLSLYLVDGLSLTSHTFFFSWVIPLFWWTSFLCLPKKCLCEVNTLNLKIFLFIFTFDGNLAG